MTLLTYGRFVAGALALSYLSWFATKIEIPETDGKVRYYLVQPAPSVQATEARKNAIAGYLAHRYRQNKARVRHYVDLAFAEARKHPDVEPELILAVIQKESSMGLRLRSAYGAVGIMQIVRRFHRDKLQQGESLLSPDVNIRVGSRILQDYIEEHGQLRTALARYSGNARGYADFVLREKKQLKAI